MNIVAIITMFFLFAMIAFVTNLAAPLGTVWKGHYEWAGMVGNLMNFAAYLFMGIPAGNMLLRIGYKRQLSGLWLWALPEWQCNISHRLRAAPYPCSM